MHLKFTVFHLTFLLLTIFSYSQEIIYLKLNVYDNKSSKPLSFAKISQCYNDTILDYVYTDFDGTCSLFVESRKEGYDDFYIVVDNIDENDSDTVFINKMKVIGNINLSFCNLVLMEYKILTQKEFEKYKLKKFKMPGRKKS